MSLGTEYYNNAVYAIENAQADIRKVVKDAFFKHYTKRFTENLINGIIKKALDYVEIIELKKVVVQSLVTFANRQMCFWKSMGLDAESVLFLSWLSRKKKFMLDADKVQDVLTNLESVEKVVCEYKKSSGNNISTDSFAQTVNGKIAPKVSALGVPRQMYFKTYWNDFVKPILDRLINDTALDPHDLTGRNSLRNRAEMEVRYNGHLENIASLKKSGVKLVVASAHADCSGRCAKWQGRVYSLDGSSGQIDGHQYVPLEVATDIYYTTKSGKTYKNGLLGFNCRHYLTQYKGQLLPVISEKERKKEYDITKKQRKMERAVRRAKTMALINKGIDQTEYKKAKKLAVTLNDEYLDFCKKNNRPSYPIRLKI